MANINDPIVNPSRRAFQRLVAKSKQPTEYYNGVEVRYIVDSEGKWYIWLSEGHRFYHSEKAYEYGWAYKHNDSGYLNVDMDTNEVTWSPYGLKDLLGYSKPDWATMEKENES